MHIAIRMRFAPVACALAAALAAAPAAAQARLTLPAEVFVGRMDFADALRLPRQELAGVRLGVDLADYAGVHGFYWRGLDEERDGAAPVQAYGAEAQLNLNSGRGFTPFLVAGLGRVDFLDGYVDLDSVRPEDRSAGIVGAGVRLDLGRVGVTAAARSWLFESTDSIGSEDLRGNVELSAGVAFRLGSARRRAAIAAPPPAVVRAAPDTVYVTRDGERVQAPAGPPQTFVTIPVPREGEIYLRYGTDSATLNRRPNPEGAALTDAQLEAVRRQLLADLRPVLRDLLASEREALRDLVRDELRRAGATALTPEAERRLLDELEARLALRVHDEVDRAGVQADTAAAVRVAPGGFRPEAREWRAYAGGNLDRPRQFLLGARVDLGPLNPRSPILNVVPELALGIGAGGTSFLVAANLQHDFPVFQLRNSTVEPYVYAGVGLLGMSDPPRGRAKREAVLNLGYGVSAPVPYRPNGPRFFLEHQGIDLFDLNRLLVGLRF